MTTQRDYYEILGVDKKATAQELKQAYRKQALQWHPDRNKSAEATDKFKEINEAYEVLSNPEKRQTYDQFGHAAFDPRYGAAGQGNPFTGGQSYRQGPFTYTYSGGGPGVEFDFGGFSDPFEIFEQFFGGASPFGSRAQRLPRYGLRISFLEAAHGTEKTVIIQGHQHTIKVPAGVDDGSRIRFDNFFITIEVLPDKKFRRDGADVVVEVQIPFTLAILGGSIKVPTVDGDVSLKIRPGTQPGTTIRLGGRGIKKLRGYGRGDEYVRLLITLPDKITARQRQALSEFEN